MRRRKLLGQHSGRFRERMDGEGKFNAGTTERMNPSSCLSFLPPSSCCPAFLLRAFRLACVPCCGVPFLPPVFPRESGPPAVLSH